MANRGFTDATTGQVHTSSTDRSAGLGTENADPFFMKGSRIAVPGPMNDDLEHFQFEPTGQLSLTKGGRGGGV